MYKSNYQRAALNGKFNGLLGSVIVEEKSYRMVGYRSHLCLLLRVLRFKGGWMRRLCREPRAGTHWEGYPRRRRAF